LVAHLLWEQGVAGSNPAVPTTSTNSLLSRAAGELIREHIQAFIADQLARWKPTTDHGHVLAAWMFASPATEHVRWPGAERDGARTVSPRRGRQA
jgi:hypothetical protein